MPGADVPLKAAISPAFPSQIISANVLGPVSPLSGECRASFLGACADKAPLRTALVSFAGLMNGITAILPEAVGARAGTAVRGAVMDLESTY